MTSVKEFRVDEPASPEALGTGAFVFTDAYSVFDWGRMPDRIPDKGASLCAMGAFNFERLEAAGVPTHYRGVVRDGETVSLDAALAGSDEAGGDDDHDDGADPPTELAIDLTVVPDLPFRDGAYDYDAYHGAAGDHYLIPLEVVFRNRVGVGSSLRTRTSPADHGLPSDEWPSEAVELPEPVVEFSTKFEDQDRYLDRSSADEIAGRAAVDALERLAREVERRVTERASRAGLTHQDGKIECLYVDGEVRVADVVGTFDENRFAHDGRQVSKEVLRQYHERTQPAWVEAVSEAKAAAYRDGVADWRALCERDPDPLPAGVLRAARDLYCAGTNVYCGREVFEAPHLDAAVSAAHDL
jgi:phosphoribosylaminoimidazole-succinocarboxamide synthase